MKDLRTLIENDENIKKVNDVLVFEALRSYNINHQEKILLKGGRLYNLLTGDKSSFDIDVQYNKKDSGIRDLEELRIFFTNYFNKNFKKFKNYFNKFTWNLSIQSIICKIPIGNLYVLKFSYCFNDRIFIPFFEITSSNFVTQYWEYSYGIYCILPSQLLLNLMDMSSQITFHKSFQCRERLNKMIEIDYLKYYFNLDERVFLNECLSQNNIPRGCSVQMRSYEELIDLGYSLTKIEEVKDKLRGLGVLEKYLFLKDGNISFHYRLKEYEKFIEVFEDARCVKDSEFIEKYQNNNKKFQEMTSINKITKFYDLNLTNLLQREVFYFKYTSSIQTEYSLSVKKQRPHKKILSPLIVLTPFAKIQKIYQKNNEFSFKELNENEVYRIQTRFKKSLEGNTEIKIPRNCLGVEPTLYVIFPKPDSFNVIEVDGKDIFYSNVLCVKKRKVYFKTLIDKKVLLEPMNLVILQESP